VQCTKRLAAGSSQVFLLLHFFFLVTDLPTFEYRHFVFLRDKRSVGDKMVFGGCHVTSVVSSSSELVIAG
jgi:hypothetical protein